MQNYAHHVTDQGIVIALDGRIDTTNAGDAEDALNAIFASEPCDRVILDCESLDYLSSTGLRVILRLAKKASEVSLVNVSSAVYEVLEMTGFTELFEVTKAYRRISIEGCPVVGRGANGVVYRIDADTMCKVYRHSDALPEIQRERELSRAAFVAGIPTAIPYDVVRVGDGYGSVFEMLNAKSMAEMVAEGTYTIEQVAKESANLLRQMAATEVDPEVMPSVRDEALTWIDALEGTISPEQLSRLRTLFSEVPDITRMVHGDFHIKNVMVQDGEPLLIDMDTLGHGNPIFDLAAMYMAYVGFGVVDPYRIDRFLGISHEESAYLWDLILRDYLGDATEEEVAAVQDKCSLVCSVRLMSWPLRHGGIKSDADRTQVEAYGKIVNEVLPRVESIAL